MAPHRLVVCAKLKGVRQNPDLSYLAINGREISKLRNICFTNANLPQGIRFPIIWENFIAYRRSIDAQWYIVDSVPIIKEHMDKNDLEHFSFQNKKIIR